jgi:hypothetical protein
MRLMFGCDISSLARAQKWVRRHRHLPRDLDRVVVVRLFGSSSSPQHLSIFLVGVSCAGRLR